MVCLDAVIPKFSQKLKLSKKNDKFEVRAKEKSEKGRAKSVVF